MPQHLSDERIEDLLECHACPPNCGCIDKEALLDLRDDRREYKELMDVYILDMKHAYYEQIGPMAERLKIAVEGLELVADQNDAEYPKQIARTYLDRIKGIS